MDLSQAERTTRPAETCLNSARKSPTRRRSALAKLRWRWIAGFGSFSSGAMHRECLRVRQVEGMIPISHPAWFRFFVFFCSWCDRWVWVKNRNHQDMDSLFPLRGQAILGLPYFCPTARPSDLVFLQVIPKTGSFQTPGRVILC